MNKINLNKGRVSLVDEADYEYLNQWSWSWHNGYAYRWTQDGKKRVRLFMHHAIEGRVLGKQTDHINRDKLDNRRANLRTVTRKENMQNRNIWGKSGERNIHRHKYGWMIKRTVDGKQEYFGTFKTLGEAIKVKAKARL